MTTVNHTPIATGAAANAATINTPLGTLDAAIVALKIRRAASVSIANNGTTTITVPSISSGMLFIISSLGFSLYSSIVSYSAGTRTAVLVDGGYTTATLDSASKINVTTPNATTLQIQNKLGSTVILACFLMEV